MTLSRLARIAAVCVFVALAGRAVAGIPASLDDTPPSMPRGLTAAPGDGQVALSWSASTGDVAGYRVFRDGRLVTTVGGTSYTNTGLANGTAYSFRVEARDEAGNESEPSDVVSATPSSCPFGGFGGGAVPGACWRPYDDASPFNKPIPADARTHPNSKAIVDTVTGYGNGPNHLLAGNADTPRDYGHPTYYSRSIDPLFTLDCVEPGWGTCAIDGATIRIPDAARPAGGGDHHMTVVDQADGWEYDMWGVSSKPDGGGTLVFRWGGRTRIDGDGLGSAATAANFGNLAGIIRFPELEAGDIDHALFMAIRCDSATFVYPATKSGRSCALDDLPTVDAAPMGARFQLMMSDAEIDALAAPEWRKTIFRAMARYGMYFGDTGGSPWGVQLESGSTYTSFGREDPFVTFGRDNDLYVDGNGDHVFSIRDGVDWKAELRVVDPCSTQGTCQP